MDNFLHGMWVGVIIMSIISIHLLNKENNNK